MGFMEPDVEKEGLCRFSMFIEPGDGFIDHDLAGVAFDLAHGFSIANEVDRILVAGLGVVAGGKPVIKTMLFRRWLLTRPPGKAQVPFSQVDS